MVPEEEDKTERYIWGLSDNIQGNVTSAGTVRLQDTIRMASSLMDQKNVARAYTIRANEKKAYAGTMPYCNKCKLRHDGPCTVKCGNCKRIGHMTRDCKAPVAATNKRALVANQKTIVTCFECGRSFVSTTFSSLIDIILTTLDVSYAVKLADGKIIRADTILRGCTLNLLNHTFNIDLMPIELGSSDVIIRMDWLSKYHAMIVYDEKIVCIPYGNEVLTIQGDRSDDRRNSILNIISCTKTQKYIKKGCHVFLAQITKGKTEDKSEEKRLEFVQIMQDFQKSFQKTCQDSHQPDKLNFKST
ncbi:putative reverse transcriptase domain-containing protein [Tanacetum coccineum]